MKVSIIIPTFNRLHHVQRLWSNLQKRLPANPTWEIIFIINGPDQKTKGYLQQSTSALVLQCERKTAAFARNQGIQQATGEWLLFLDDDIEIPVHYFPTALAALKQLPVDVLGGPEIAHPRSNPFQLAYAYCQAHPFVTGHTHYRHHCQGNTPTLANEGQLILCHLWMRKEIFLQGFQFPSHYPRNEENVLLYQLQKAGKKLYHHPQLSLYHTKKETIRAVVKATWTSGRYRMRSLIQHPGSLNPLFLAPALLLILPPQWTIAPYGMLWIFSLLQCATKTKSTSITNWTALLIPTIHLSYGAGLLMGFFSLPSFFKQTKLQ